LSTCLYTGRSSAGTAVLCQRRTVWVRAQFRTAGGLCSDGGTLDPICAAGCASAMLGGTPHRFFHVCCIFLASWRCLGSQHASRMSRQRRWWMSSARLGCCKGVCWCALGRQPQGVQEVDWPERIVAVLQLRRKPLCFSRKLCRQGMLWLTVVTGLARVWGRWQPPEWQLLCDQVDWVCEGVCTSSVLWPAFGCTQVRHSSNGRVVVEQCK